MKDLKEQAKEYLYKYPFTQETRTNDVMVDFANQVTEELQKELFITKEIVSSVELDKEGAQRIFHENQQLKKSVKILKTELQGWDNYLDEDFDKLLNESKE